MERESLKAIFSEAAASEWTLQSDIQLLEWLQGFSQGLERKTDTVSARLHELVEETTSVEQDLHNTLNFLRGLSNSQFIENRVYEEDETSEQVPAPAARKEAETVADGYEDGIVPRYKEAVLTAWGVFKDRKLDSKHSFSTEFDTVIAGKTQRPLPFIIGTDEFLKDVNCGLAELLKHNPFEPISAAESDTEIDESDLAGGIPADMPDGEWSDFSEVQTEGLEPAVSAALDFKAMLEAALRGPSLFYGDGSVPEAGGSHNFVGEVGNVSSDSSKISQDSDRNMFENREHKIEEDDQADAATREEDTHTSLVDFRPLQEEGAQSWDQHQVHETPQDAEGARSDSEFEFSASGMTENATWDDEKEPIPIPHSGRNAEAQSNDPSKVADPPPRSLPGVSPGSLLDSSESVEQTEVRGSSTGPTVPDELFGHGHQSQKPGSLSGKFSYTKGSLHDSLPRREVSAQVPPIALTNDNPPPAISYIAGRFKKTASVLPKPAVKHELRVGLFDEDEDEDEDDSYISQLIKQRSTITKGNKSFRSWSTIGAGRGLFDENDETTTAQKDQDEPSVSEGLGSAGDLGDTRVLATQGPVVLERDELPSVQVNSADLLTVKEKEQGVDSEDESLSWSSREKEKQSLHQHTPSPDQLEVRETASPNASRAKEANAHRPGHLETSPRRELDRNDCSKEADFKTQGTTLHARAASVSPSLSSDDSTTLRHVTSSDQRAAQGMLSQEVNELGPPSSRGSVQSLNGLAKGPASKAPLHFGDDEDEDEDVDEDDLLVGKADSSAGPANRAPHLDFRRTMSFSQPLLRSLPVSHVDEEMDRSAGLPATTTSEEGPRQRALMPVGSSQIGSAYLSSLLFGDDDDEDNEDELFGKFQKGPARTRASLFGSQIQTPVVDRASSADSGRGDVEADGIPLLRPSPSPHDNKARPGQPQSSLFDD